MSAGKREWSHAGTFYGRNGDYVGDYFNTDAGWFVNIGFPPVRRPAASRRAAIALIEAANATPATGTGETQRPTQEKTRSET